MREFQAQMVDDVAGQAAKIARFGDDVAPEMTVDQAGNEPDTPCCDEDPGEKEMDHASGREIVRGGDRRPRREGLIVRPVLRPAFAQESAGVEIMAQNAGNADGPAAVLFAMDVEDGVVELLVAVACLRAAILLVAEAGLLSEIEDRVGVEDLQPARHHEKQRRGPDPMGQACPCRLTIEKLCPFRTVYRRCRHFCKPSFRQRLAASVPGKDKLSAQRSVPNLSSPQALQVGLSTTKPIAAPG